MIHSDKFQVEHTNVLRGPDLVCREPGCPAPVLARVASGGSTSLATLVSLAEAHWAQVHHNKIGELHAFLEGGSGV